MVGGGWVKSYLRTRIARLVPSMRRLAHLSLVSPLFSLLFSTLVYNLLSSRFSSLVSFPSSLAFLSCLVFSCLSFSLSLSVSLCLSVSVSLSVCFSCLVCVVLCGVSRCGRGVCLVCVCVCECLCCSTLQKRGKFSVWIQKTPPCVHSKRPGVLRHHAHMCFNMCAWCRYTRGRFERTHGDVLNVHTGGVLNVHTERGVVVGRGSA